MRKIEKNVGVVVVLYRPSKEQIKHAANLNKICSLVIIVDNSPMMLIDEESWSRGCQYCWMGGNLGIAAALNQGCYIAKNAGSEYALLLDQDTTMTQEMLFRHVEEARRLFADKNIAVVATSTEFQASELRHSKFYAESVISSGSLIRLTSWLEVGKFKDELFIDQVDHEFCYRLRSKGHLIVVNADISMTHTVGNPLQRKVLGQNLSTTNHEWYRRYYQVRNSLYLRKWYPSESKPLRRYMIDLLGMAMGIILIEKDRVPKIYAMVVGVVDFLRNRLGPWGKHLKGGDKI